MISQNKIQEVKNRFEIVGNHTFLNRAIEKALKVAPTDISVLISGESGVGKEAFSKIIHHTSKRKHGHFIAVNCAAIPEGTIDSELFGHEKGAFTNAYDSRKGYFETVNGGTIFLDEISELPLETQSRLLRVLETGEFIKVGSSNVMKTDVRLIAASNKDLLEQTKNNKFREDLFYRLSTVTIPIPALRNRKEDIMFLAARFAMDFAEKYKTPLIEFNDEAVTMLQTQYWPGNIRQLKNLVEQISILEAERNITGAILHEYLPEAVSKELVPIKQHSFEADDGVKERDLLYKFLIDIRKDVTEVKTAVYDVLKNVRNQGDDFEQTIETATDRLLKAGNNLSDASYRFGKDNDITDSEVYSENTDVIEVQETLSLAEKEKEMIKVALVRHKGKRKPAAKELGISERTLYRKIKEYSLEDL
ncbi:MAG: sigma-54-dependent Fis family transcriptional regulator [Bacteroidetes bacterium]|nr:sigma-54-dependent Fis family transcriptional regulator [Bacteroidota bacterium]MBT5530310.1 sigma-54-dependent Fis family transcriptional regulator [Cytophagia bacterium]MBT3421937.1 sigma-54-dependent Fis family transcriptional regulator [Bacteroidota bacterium]MBT3799993.1 sigma-54-dependent Fis family transcriptional regulator [Bacteroidota bacterium]MBT3934484.1 sigma-54-dependent Fis family transcriptional regulator [Bacteroidota bacterium]